MIPHTHARMHALSHTHTHTRSSGSPITVNRKESLLPVLFCHCLPVLAEAAGEVFVFDFFQAERPGDAVSSRYDTIQ